MSIKAKMLLPAEVNEEGEEEDPRQELVEKLLEYKMYKYMSLELKDRMVDAGKAMYKPPTLPDEVKDYRQPVDLDELLDGSDADPVKRGVQGTDEAAGREDRPGAKQIRTVGKGRGEPDGQDRLCGRLR